MSDKIKKVEIMLVDDDEDDRVVFSYILNSIDKNIECQMASNGEHALQILKNKSSLPDLIFMDVNMPIMNGFKCLSILKRDENLKDVPVVIYSTSDQISAKETAGQLGALMYLTKPNDHKKLKALLQELLISRSLITL